MKTITRLLATAALLFGVVGGVSSVKAGNVYGTISVANDCSWNAGTATATFTGVNGWQILYTGLPSGDITPYKKFHVTLSEMSANIANIRLCIKDKDDHAAYTNLYLGENNINLAALAKANPTVDFTNIKNNDITLWSPSSSVSTVDGEHPASVKIQNVYMQRVQNVVNCTGLAEEITDLADITDGSKFIISNSGGTNVMYFTTGENNSSNAAVSSVPSDGFFYYTLDKVTDSGVEGGNIFRIKVQNEAGTAFSGVDGGAYLNTPNSGWSISFSGLSANEQSNGKTYGQDANNNGLWYVTYDGEKGFSFQNVGKANDGNGWPSWLKVDGLDGGQKYLKLYKSLGFEVNTELDKEDNEADETIFDFANATGYDAETGTFTNGGWTFATPVDISNWDYIVITTQNNPSAISCKISIADNDGKSVTGNQYTGSAAVTGGDMYLDRWNNQNAIRISVDYLRATKGLDVSKIKSLTFANNSGGDIVISIANVYLTDYNNTKINGGYCEGDVKREYSVTGKYGTICLPYKASYAGAEIYSISGKTSNGITLTKVTGLLEAGKPYFYMSADENGQNNAGTVRNVNFFRADLAAYDAASPVENNGLIGTFSDMTAPAGENYWILSGNKLYDTENCTGDDAVTVGANKAYINTSLIASVPSASRSAFIMFDEATGIKAVQGNEVTAKQEGIFNLNGQRLNQLKKGLNIVNGKKVMVK